MEDVDEYRIVVMGNPRVGKSALVRQFVYGIYQDEEGYVPFIGDERYLKRLEVGGQQCSLYIVDTDDKGQLHPALFDLYVKDCQGFILMYSVTHQSTFNEMQNIQQKIIRAKGTSQVPMAIVGSKCDLKKERVVSEEQGLNLARCFRNCSFFETSAKENINVHEVFYDIAQRIHKNVSEEKRKAKKSNCVLM